MPLQATPADQLEFTMRMFDAGVLSDLGVAKLLRVELTPSLAESLARRVADRQAAMDAEEL